jgi:hypothetical protein
MLEETFPNYCFIRIIVIRSLHHTTTTTTSPPHPPPPVLQPDLGLNHNYAAAWFFSGSVFVPLCLVGHLS